MVNFKLSDEDRLFLKNLLGEYNKCHADLTQLEYEIQQLIERKYQILENLNSTQIKENEIMDRIRADIPGGKLDVLDLIKNLELC